MLDLSIWNEEYSAGIARTGGGVPMEGGNAKSVNDVDPPMGRFVRIYTGRRSGGNFSLSVCACNRLKDMCTATLITLSFSVCVGCINFF